jgi:chromosomal replication initiation ATPase DnaA
MIDDDLLDTLERRRADALTAEFLLALLALDTGVPARSIRTDRRRPDAARARQMAMYLAHVGLGWPLQRVGAAFGRDRSTAGFACDLIEDLREAEGFDARLDQLEACVRSAPLEPAPVLA